MWVKLWDVGFAVVMLIDNMLYQLLPHGPPMTDKATMNPGAAITALLSVDPTYSQHTYYNLLATCMAAVPVLTAFLVKRGGGDFVSMASDNLTHFSGRVGNSMASYTRSLKAQSEMNRFNRNMDAASTRALSSLESDPIFMAAAYGKVADIAAGSVANTQAIGPTKNFTAGLRALANSSASHRQAVMKARAEQVVSHAMFAEGYALHNRAAAQSAIRSKYYSHDFYNSYVGAEDVNMEKAYATYQVSGAAAPIINGAIKTVLDGGGFFGKSSGLATAPMLIGMLGRPLPAENTPGTTNAKGEINP